MPSIKDDSTVEAIARVFCGEGKRNKAATLRIVGYSDSYCDNRGTGVVYTNDRVKAAIKMIDEQMAKEHGWSLERSQSLLLSTFDQATDLKQPSAAVSAVTAINRLYGMDKDNDQRNADTPAPLTAEDLATLMDMARKVTDNGLRAASG